MGTQESSDMLGEQLHNCNPVKYGRATCLPHKGVGVPLSALPKDTTSKLAGLFSTLERRGRRLSHLAEYYAARCTYTA